LPKAKAYVLIANKLGFSDLSGDSVKISDITDENKTANFIARIVSAFEVKEFTRSDETIGRVGNLIVGDETGKIRVTLWDNIADLLKTGGIKVGQTVQISGSVKYGYSGIEIHIGNNDVLTKSEEQIEVTERALQIKDIKDGMGDLNLIGIILEISDVRTFKRKDGTAGKVGNLLLGDSTGAIRVVLWDEKTDILTGVECGDSIYVINGYARENAFSQQVELNLGTKGVIRKSEKTVEYRETFTNIADIIPGKSFSVQGKISEIGDLREFDREDGTESAVANLELKDETGNIKLTLWGDQAYTIESLDIDSEIQIINAYAKKGLYDKLELSAGNRSKMVIR
jgi:replication factor A1